MNPIQPLTRRDVVALFAYVILIAGALQPILYQSSSAIASRLPTFASTAKTSYQVFPVVVTVIVSVLLLPFVPLVASGVAGDTGDEPLTKQGIPILLLSCIGLTVFMLGLTELFTFTYHWWMAYASQSTPSGSFVELYNRIQLAAASIRMSIGFALAFLPAIFDSMRHRIRNEDSVS